MKKKGRIFVISAPSGCGKTTICKRVLKNVKNLAPSTSMTTRAPRRGEKNKRDYFYVDEKTFKEAIRGGKLLEWEEHFGYFYGTPKRFVVDKLKKGTSLLLSIDVKGAMRVKQVFTDSVLIFVRPPSMAELARRLRKRNTDGKREVARRLRRAKMELGFLPKYDYVVINNDLEEAVGEVIAIVKNERSE